MDIEAREKIRILQKRLRGSGQRGRRNQVALISWNPRELSTNEIKMGHRHCTREYGEVLEERRERVPFGEGDR